MGNGGPDWTKVNPLMEQSLDGLKYQIFTYEAIGQ